MKYVNAILYSKTRRSNIPQTKKKTVLDLNSSEMLGQGGNLLYKRC